MVIIHNCPKQEHPKCTSTDEWTNKMWYSHAVETIQQWKETTDVYNINETEKHTKWKKADTEDFILYDSIYLKS